ncbi:PD40 domain-containing protein [candidate division WOR-3 bacterium]|nr:PD40 domain-containing protein [candidate division WOR-3 bacterium]
MKRILTPVLLIVMTAFIAGCGPGLPEGLTGEIAFISPVDNDGAHDIFVLKLPSKDTVRITNTSGNNVENVWIDWSTEDMIAYASNREAARDYEVYIYDFVERKETRLTNNDYFDGYPTFSPNGRFVAFSSERPTKDPDDRPQREIYFIDLATGSEERLTKTPESELDLSWSPDGTRIAFAKSVSGFYQIFVYYIESKETKQLTDVQFSNSRFPKWTPDAQRIIFSSNRGDTENAGDKRRNSIYVMNAEDGSDVKTILIDNVNSYNSPHISPDGKWLTYSEVDTDWPKGENIMLRAFEGEDTKAYTLVKNKFFNRNGPWKQPTGI